MQAAQLLIHKDKIDFLQLSGRVRFVNNGEYHLHTDLAPNKLSVFFTSHQWKFVQKVMKMLVEGDVWRWLCRHVHQQISSPVYGGPSGHIKDAQTGSKNPHHRKRKLTSFHFMCSQFCIQIDDDIIFFGCALLYSLEGRTCLSRLQKWNLN